MYLNQQFNFYKYLLRVYLVLGTVLDTKALENKTDKNPCPGIYILVRAE